MPDVKSTSRSPNGDTNLNSLSIDAPVEILAYLRDLQQHQVLITLTAPGGHSVNTYVWAIDAQAQQISFDAGKLKAHERALLDADELSAVAYLDSIKLQFELEGLTLVIGSEGAALRAKLPPVLYRFQRRETFRVKPVSGSVPVVRLLHPHTQDKLCLRVLDLSIGGMALQLPPDLPPIEGECLLRQVQVELARDIRFEVGLRVHHVGPMHPATLGTQLGCAFVNLPREANLDLQVFIDQTQKRHRLLHKR